MAQQALFDGQVAPAATPRPLTARRPTPAGDARKGETRDPIEIAAARLATVDDPLERARLAGQLRDLAAAAFASSIRDASANGRTWREIGAALDVPFQTLHR